MPRNIAKPFYLKLSMIDITPLKPKYKCFYGEDVELVVDVIDEANKPLDISETSAKVYYITNDHSRRQDSGITYDPDVVGRLYILVKRNYLYMGSNIVRVVLFDKDQEVYLQPAEIICLETGVGETPETPSLPDMDVKNEISTLHRIKSDLSYVNPIFDDHEERIQSITEHCTGGNGTNTHSHSNKTVIDSISNVKVAKWDNYEGLIKNNTEQLDTIKNYTNIVDMINYPKLANEIDDTNRLKRAISDITVGSTFKLEPYFKYTTSEHLSIADISGLTLQGQFATITYIGNSVGCVLSIMSTSVKTINTGISVSNTTNKLPITDVEKGDFINVKDNWSLYYPKWIWGEVLEVCINDIVLSEISEESFTSTKYEVIRPINNIKVFDLTINSTTKTIGFNLKYCKNFKIEGLVCNGLGGRVGISVESSILGNISRNVCDNFYDTAMVDAKTGYGIMAFGHDITVSENTLSNCKHMIAGGGLSNRLLYFKNIVYGSTNALSNEKMAMIDAHGLCECTCDSNTIYNANTAVFYMRGKNCKVINNTIHVIDNLPSYFVSVWFSDQARGSITIDNNKIINNQIQMCFARIEPNVETYKNHTVLSITNNMINGDYQFKNFNNLTDWKYDRIIISNNKPVSTNISTPLVLNGIRSDSLYISNNEFRTFGSEYAVGIFMDKVIILKEAFVLNNNIIFRHSGGGDGIIYKDYPSLNIKDNIFDMDVSSRKTLRYMGSDTDNSFRYNNIKQVLSRNSELIQNSI